MLKRKNTCEDLTAIMPKQFRKTIDNHIKVLLRTQTIQNSNDIFKCISELKEVESVKQGKESLTVEMIGGKNTDLKVIFIMKNLKLDFIQSISEQQQKADSRNLSRKASSL